MSGRRPFDALRSRLSPERRERNRSAGEAVADEVASQDVWALRQHSRADGAVAVSRLKPAIAELERRDDMSVGDLARSIKALGGQLVITAEFPEESVTLRLGTRKEAAGLEARGETS